VYGNNIHVEGVVKDVKSKPDVKLTCKEPVSYLWENYRNLKRNARMLVNALDQSEHTIARRKDKVALERVMPNSIGMVGATKDAIFNEIFNNADMVWETGSRGKKMKEKKILQLNEVISLE